jgi:lipoprotein-anchoring transpeptidase ErfK/SrfK
MRHILSLATFAFAGLVATSAAEAAGGASILPAPQVLVSDEPSIADPTPREVVNFTGPQEPGTVIINTSERRLYFVLPDQQAIRYGVGVGRPGFEWAGVEHIASKREWPDWTPPSQMIERRPDLPRHMAGESGEGIMRR